ncbi:hypothetical protein [Glutamicibacter arilaitensis]|uniref:hypothetical protein n=1 Tax=Glutamicibacter arilaitensis TaxID=256701 RepID=UPI00384FB751
MNLLITWALSLIAFVIVFYSAAKARTVPASEQPAAEKAPFGKRVKSLFAAFDVISWGLFIAAICFLVAAVAQTISEFG